MSKKQQDRGQAYSLEGLTAAIIMVTSVIFALNATAITPLTSSTSNKQIEEQSRILADDLLDSAAEDDELVETILFYDKANGSFEGADADIYTRGPPTEFGESLNKTLGDRNYAYNLYVLHLNSADEVEQKRVVYMGVPSENAATAMRTVALRDSMNLTVQNDNTSIGNTSEFYAEDYAPNSTLYNLVKIKLVVWKM